MTDGEDWRAWIGRCESVADMASPSAMERLAALLDHEHPPWRAGEVPPLGHWLCFLPRARMSQIGSDGHPERGGFLPPIDLPRRMWAGSQMEFRRPIAIGAEIERRSTIADVRRKTGASGQLVFVTIAHEVSSGGEVALVEQQDLVYREAPAAGAAAATAAAVSERRADVERMAAADPVALFRYSALTFNGHRIHYDRDYARDVEGYDGLVVQGPFVATLLMDLVLRRYPGARVERFAFRGVRPLLDTAPFTLCLSERADGIDLWCRDDQGQETMTAQAVIALP